MSHEDRPPEDPGTLYGNSATELFRHALEETPTGRREASGDGHNWLPPEPGRLEDLLPGFQITKLLGRGGMGAVYLGRQMSLDRTVAIKLLPAELAANAEFVVRFQREAQTLARLQHPGIVAVHDSGRTQEGHLYFVMEHVDGTDLHRIIHGPGLAPSVALELTIQICEALHYAHTQGVIHRDVKPANVLITTGGRAKLADFGLARPLARPHAAVTSGSLIIGTPDYMAPEQWAGEADHRADIYALGVMLYEMLTGSRPKGVFDLPSQRAAVDERFDEVVLKAMRQEPERRYQQVSELRDEVERIRTAPLPVFESPAAPAGKGSAPPGKARSTVWWWTMAAAAVLVALGSATPFIFRNHGTRPAAELPVPAPVAGPGPGQAENLPPGQPVREPEAAPGAAPRVAPALITETGTTNAPSAPATPTAPVSVEVRVAPPASQSPGAAPAPPPLPVPPPASSAKPMLLGVFSTEAQNLTAWALAPLDEEVPADLRQRLTFLREDLVDEGKSNPSANIEAYRVAYDLCEGLLSALKDRDTSRTAAGYRAVQAAANQVNTSQSLEARRNYMMSWPQYAREQRQRDDIQRQSAGREALANESQKLAWTKRAGQHREQLDALYRQFRAALREGAK